MTTPLYPWPGNFSELPQFLNYTVSNVCVDVSNPLTCGAYIFFDAFLVVLFIIFFTIFKNRHSLKDSYSSSSTIVMFIGIIIFLLGYNWVRSTELIMLIANEIISILVLYLVKD
jgi:hypothetical protein